MWFGTYFLINDRGEKFNIYDTVAYLLLLDLFILKKVGKNINRRYELYVETFGRLLAVNGVCVLFHLAADAGGMIWQEAVTALVLALIQTAEFTIVLTLLKKMAAGNTEICVITSQDGYEAALEKIRENETVFLSDIPADERNALLKFCYDQGKEVYCTTKLSDIIVRGCELAQYRDQPVIFSKRFGIGIGNRALKRVLDVVCSLVLLIVLSPVFLVVAICIKLEDHGPVIYRQTRCTKDMKQFEIYKFRSMIPDAEKAHGAQLATENDKRLTKTGRFIRNVKLDELPQLVNILKGDMSFVGPRPERPELIAEALKNIPEFALRTKVKAGLTGYAQVMGNYNTDFLDKLKWDLMYIENYSVFLDFKIVLMTFFAVFRRENNEDFSKWE
jgi:exopolysaccharide biosynthesis polyprenyl glycosylphosphotransferase